MKVVFIETTNQSAQCIVGKEVTLQYSLTASFQYDPTGLGFDYRKGTWGTSIIKSINIEEVSRNCYDITIATNNSKYVFRKGELSEKKPLTEDELLVIGMSMMF